MWYYIAKILSWALMIIGFVELFNGRPAIQWFAGSIAISVRADFDKRFPR